MQEGLADWDKVTGQVWRCLCGPPGHVLNKHEQMLREELGEGPEKLWSEMGVTCPCLTLPSLPPVTVADLSFSC